MSVTCEGTPPWPGTIVTWKTHWVELPIPVFVALVITFTRDPPATPTRTWMFVGAPPFGAHVSTESVIAMCARLMWFGVVSMNGNSAPPWRPSRIALSEISRPVPAAPPPSSSSQSSSSCSWSPPWSPFSPQSSSRAVGDEPKMWIAVKTGAAATATPIKRTKIPFNLFTSSPGGALGISCAPLLGARG